MVLGFRIISCEKLKGLVSYRDNANVDYNDVIKLVQKLTSY